MISGSPRPQSPTAQLEVLGVGATREELEEAFAWLNADDVLGRQLHRQPSGRVAELCEILQPEEEEGPGPG